MYTSVMASIMCRSLETAIPAAIIRRLPLNGTTRYPRFLFNAPPLALLSWAVRLTRDQATERFRSVPRTSPVRKKLHTSEKLPQTIAIQE